MNARSQFGAGRPCDADLRHSRLGGYVACNGGRGIGVFADSDGMRDINSDWCRDSFAPTPRLESFQFMTGAL